MIDINSYPIFLENITTLKETSRSNPDGKTETFLTESQLQVVNFDKVKEEYVRPLGLPEQPFSNDALYMDGDGNLTFIEFKDGFTKEYDIRRKCFDSLLIFTGIIDRGTCFTRENMDYILVYAPEKNEKSKDKISTYFSKKGGRELIKFRLGVFENYCFKEVHTYTPEEFEEKFVKKHEH